MWSLLCSRVEIFHCSTQTLVVACRLCCSIAHGILVPWPRIEPAFPVLQASFLTLEHQGSSSSGPQNSGRSLGLFSGGSNYVAVGCPLLVTVLGLGLLDILGHWVNFICIRFWGWNKSRSACISWLLRGRLLGGGLARCWQEFTLFWDITVVLLLTNSFWQPPPPHPNVNSTDLGSEFCPWWWFFLFMARKLDLQVLYLNVYLIWVCKGKLLSL